MALVTFYQIFNVLNETTLEFIHRTRIGDIVFEAGAPLHKGLVVGGIDFFRYFGNEMEITIEEDGTHSIERVYVS